MIFLYHLFLLVYGTAEGYSLYLEPGAYWLSFSAFWWDKGSWNATTTSVYVYPVGGEKGDALGSFRPDDGYGATTAQAGNLKVDIYNSYKYSFEIETAGNYVLEFFTPSSAGWSGQCIGAIELSNQYSEAFKYLLMLENAQAAANAGIKAYHCIWGAKAEEREQMLTDPEHQYITSPLQIIDILRSEVNPQSQAA